MSKTVSSSARTYNLPRLVNAECFNQGPIRAGRNQIIQILHSIRFGPQKSVFKTASQVGASHYLARVVNSISLAEGAAQCVDILHRGTRVHEEGVGCSIATIRPPGNLTSGVDCRSHAETSAESAQVLHAYCLLP